MHGVLLVSPSGSHHPPGKSPEYPGTALSAEAGLLYAAYQRKPLNLLMTVIAAPAITLLLWPYFPAWALVTWTLVLLVTAALGYVEVALFRRAWPGVQALPRWQAVFAAQTVLGGAAWSLGPTIIMWHAGGPESVDRRAHV